ncbi:MAG: helix-turn-helix domain-containing protein [Dehalococcoidia bacterium]|nr:helix-turn-helix domain-containing protein [Dehalococcoidia bacterium]
MRKEFGKGSVGKGNDGGGISGLPRHTDIEKRLCITVPEAAAMLGLSRNFTYELVKQGQLPVIRFGKRLLIPRVALEKKLEEGIMVNNLRRE